MSLTHRLLALTLVASLPGLAAVSYGAFDLRNTRYAEARTQALRNAEIVVSEVDQIFDGIQSAMRAVAETDEVSRLNSTACTDYVVRVRPSIAPLTSLLVIGLDGNIRCFSEPSLASPNLAARDYFAKRSTTENSRSEPLRPARSRTAISFRWRCRSSATERSKASLPRA
jgi:hypothetical protein